MARAYVFNFSKVRLEPAMKTRCPRCKGHGGKFPETGPCTLCGGEGEVWRSESGWIRRVGARMEQSELY